MTTRREPALKRPQHPAADLPSKPAHSATASPVVAAASNTETPERFTEQHNVRIRPSTKARLSRGVDKLRYETGDRSISAQSVTDAALNEWLDKHGV